MTYKLIIKVFKKEEKSWIFLEFGDKFLGLAFKYNQLYDGEYKFNI